MIKKLFVFLIYFLCQSLWAEPLASGDIDLLNALLPRNAKPNYTTADFYKTGQLCYQKQMTGIAYYVINRLTYIWTNDKSGNCLLIRVPLNLAKSIGRPASICVITPDLAKIIFSDATLSGSRQYDFNGIMNPVLTNVSQHVISCLDKQMVPLEQVEALTFPQQ
jgi:hypothetical protein